jgi:hypothetical protein
MGRPECHWISTGVAFRLFTFLHLPFVPRLGACVVSSLSTGSDFAAAGVRLDCPIQMSPCDHPRANRFCSVGLQADTMDSSTCPPEGGRSIDEERVLTQTRQSLPCHFASMGSRAAPGLSAEPFHCSSSG